MDKGKISVIIPVYNAQNSIEACVNSICMQTYENLEIILVDDGSVDSSLEICQYIALKDNRIKVIHQENKGSSAARNAGIKVMRGEYLTFVDADDLLVNPNIYNVSVSVLQKKEIDMVVFNWEDFDVEINSVSEQSHIGDAVISSERVATEMIADNYNIKYGGGYPWNKIWKVEKLLKNGHIQYLYNTELFAYEDKLFVLQCLSKCNRIQTISQIGYRYMIYQNSMSHSEEKKVERRKNVIKAHEFGEEFYKSINLKLKKEIKKNKAILIINYTSDARVTQNYKMLAWLWPIFLNLWKDLIGLFGLKNRVHLVWIKNVLMILPIKHLL